MGARGDAGRKRAGCRREGCARQQASAQAGRTSAGRAGAGTALGLWAARAQARGERRWERGAGSRRRDPRWGAQQVRGHGTDARGRAAGVRWAAIWAACERLGVLNWARLGVFVHLTQFLTRFDSALFLSH